MMVGSQKVKKEFYSSKINFTGNSIHLTQTQSFSIKTTDNVISQDDRDELDQPITVDEMTKAVKTLQSDKVPGCDGF